MKAWIRLFRAAALLGVVALGAVPAGAGYLWMEGSNPVMWRAASPADSWDDATSTLKWTLTTNGFPHANLPTVEEAGAGLENGFKSIDDVTGARIRTQRLGNTTGRLANDGFVTVEFHTDPGPHPHPQVGDMTGIFGQVVAEWATPSGTITSMDIVFNATQGDSFDWSIQHGDNATFDVETTLVHEALHAIGIGHTPYFFAGIFQVGRFPEIELFDRCYSPHDRNFIRLAYPQGSPVAAITGNVAPSVSNAIVVATDSSGVAQVAGLTDGSGNYSLSVPPGSGYSVTAGHVNGIGYGVETGGTITRFLGCDTQTANAPGSVNLTTTGTTAPQMRLRQIDGGFQALFLPRGFNGNAVLTVGGTFAAGDVQAPLDFGSGIVATVASTANRTLQTVLGPVPVTDVTCNVAVAGGAAPGTRNLSLTRTNGERLFVPGAILVRDTGALTISGTSTAAAVPLSTPSHVMLRFDLQATGVEDVRVRRLVFDVSGTGPAVPAVRLWRDANGNDAFEPGMDARVLTSAAYGNAVPDETITYPGGNGQVTFDLIAVSILAGQTETFFLTFDFPAAGTGTYAVSLSPTGFSNLTHGMFYGDVVTPTGGAAGGTMTIGALGISNLGQFENAGANPAIPVGGATAQTSVILRGVVTGTSGNLSMDVEVKAVGTPFDGAVSGSSTPTATSGQTHSVTVAGLTNATSYHWRARAVSSVVGPGPWQSFGNNADGSIDFSVDNSTTTIGGLEQLGSDLALLPIGGTSEGVVFLRATVTNSAAIPTRLEVEVVPAGAAFANAATLSSDLVASGTVASVSFTGPLTGDYRWQARAVNPFGTASAWTDFGANGTLLDFHLDAVNELNASSGCTGRASGAGARAACLLAGSLLLAAFARRRRSAAAAALILLMAVPALAHEPERDLPAALSAESPAQKPPEASASLSVYLGVEFLDLEFDALGADLRDRNLEGIGLPTLGVEGLLYLGEDLRLGAALEAAYWGDTRVLSAGPVLAWRFAVGGEVKFQPPEMEHSFKLGMMYRQLEVSKSGFGDFDPAFGLRGGYELRLNVGEWLMLVLAADVRYSVFGYDGDVLSGDDETGGLGVLISVGLAWLP